MGHWILSFCWFFLLEPISFEILRRFEPIPTEYNLFLKHVSDVALDDRGRVYISEYPSQTVIRWNSDGAFSEVFGSKEREQEDLSLGSPSGPSKVFIEFMAGLLFVCDAGGQSVKVFNSEFEFEKRLTFAGLSNEILDFHVLSLDRLLFYDRSFCGDQACRRILLFDGQGTLRETWRVSPDCSMVQDFDTEKESLYPGKPHLVLGFHRGFGEVVLAHGGKPLLEIRSIHGKNLGILPLNIPLNVASQSDQNAIMIRSEQKSPGQTKIAYPNAKSLFNKVLSLDHGYLIYHESTIDGSAEGVYLNRQGKMIGSISLHSGKGGGLYSTHGRLFQFIVTEQRGYSLRELAIRVSKVN